MVRKVNRQSRAPRKRRHRVVFAVSLAIAGILLSWSCSLEQDSCQKSLLTVTKALSFVFLTE